MFITLVALAAGVGGFLIGAAYACSVLHEEESETTSAPTITSSTVHFCECGSAKRRRY